MLWSNSQISSQIHPLGLWATKGRNGKEPFSFPGPHGQTSITSLTSCLYSTMTCAAACGTGWLSQRHTACRKRATVCPAALTDAHKGTHISLQVPVRRPDNLSDRLTKNPDHRGEVEGGKPYASFYKQILAQPPGNSSAGTAANSPKADTVWKHTRLASPESKNKFQGRSTVAKHACNGKFPSPSGHRRFLWFLNRDSEQRPGHTRPGHTSPTTLVLQALSK